MSTTTKNKKQERKRVLNYKIEAAGRTFDFGGQKLTVLPEEEPDIKIHFLRFGALPFHPKKSHLLAKLQLEEGQHGKDKDGNLLLDEVIIMEPKLENFCYVKTGLQTGYVYIIDESDTSKPTEYLVDESGNFTSVNWGNGKYDIRETDGKITTDGYHLAPFETTIWAAYSSVQWSIAYYNEMRDNMQKRKKRMTKIQCTGYHKEAPLPTTEDTPYTAVQAYFSDEKANACKRFQQKIDSIKFIEDKKEEENKKEEELHTDMFVTLNDPIGCAIDINAELADKVLDFKALVDAIQTGESIEEVYQRLANGNFQGPAPDTEYQSLFSLALTSYFMVYNDLDTIEKYDGGKPGINAFEVHSQDNSVKVHYNRMGQAVRKKNVKAFIGYGLDHAKLDGILGIEARKKSRKVLQQYRNDFGSFMKSDSMKTVLEDYLHNLCEQNISGRALILEMLEVLFINPYDLDQHLLLAKDYSKTDQWKDWILSIIDEESKKEYTNTDITSQAPGFENLDPLYGLLGVGLNLDKVLDKKFGFSHKIAKVFRSKLKFHATQAAGMKEINGVMYKEWADKQEFIVKKLNKNLQVFGEEMFEIRDKTIHLRLEELGVEIDPQYVKNGKYTGAKKDIIRILKESEIKGTGDKGIEILQTKKGRKGQNKIKLSVRERILGTKATTAKRNIKIATLVNGRAFNGVFAFLELLNFGSSVNKVIEERDFKSKINAIGASVKLTEASLNLRKAYIVNAGKEVTKKFTTVVRTVGVIGGVFAVGLCFRDSFEAADKGDLDTGLALAGAGLAFSVSTMASLGIVFSAAGPVGWIAVGIGIGLIIAVAFLTDTEVETFFKNFLLSDTKAFPLLAGESPMTYSRRVLANKASLVDDDYMATLMHPADAEASLLDAIVCTRMEFEPEKVTYSRPVIISRKEGISSSTMTVHSFKVTMTYHQFFNEPDQVEYLGFLYPSGIKYSEPQELSMTARDVQKVKDSNGQDAVQITFSIDEHLIPLIRENSQLLFTTRLALDKSVDMYFPYSMQGQKRWLGALVKIQKASSMFLNLTQNKDVKIASLYQLQDKRTW